MTNTTSGRGFDLRALFEPKSIALIGATDKSQWSLNTFLNIQASDFEGRTYLVNPRTSEVHGQKTYPSIESLPEVVDLVFVMVPTGLVLDTLKSAVARGTRAAVVLTAGFGEVGEEGKRLEQELVDFATESGLALLGPNGNGFINAAEGITPYGLPVARPLLEGNVGFVLQSGALASAVLGFANTRNVGTSFLTAMGNEAVISVTDVMEYLIDSPKTNVIALFLESVRDVEEFRRVTKKAILAGKPVVALKVGRSELGAQAALAHTGALVGDDGVNDAAFEQMGVTRVSSVEELIITAGLFNSLGGPLAGPRMGVVTPSGGASEVIADRSEDEGIELPAFSDETIAALSEILPDFATPQNPLDVTGYVVIDRTLTRRALVEVAKDPNIDFAIFNWDMPKVEGPDHALAVEVFSELADTIKQLPMPVAIIGTVLTDVTEYGRRLQAESGLPYVLGGIDLGITAIGRVISWSDRYRAIIAAENTPVETKPEIAPAGAEGMWTEHRAAEFLAEHGVSVVPSRLADTAEEAIAHAEEFGYPVVVKAVADGLGHKSDIGGVRLNLNNADDVREAHDQIIAALQGLGATGVQTLVQPQRSSDGVELIVGIVRDPAWGLALAVGLGGIWVEVMKDAAISVLPVSAEDIKKSIKTLRAYPLLEGVRGQKPVDIDALANEIATIADVAYRLGDRLEALEVNPLRASADGIEALDALVTWADSAE